MQFSNDPNISDKAFMEELSTGIFTQWVVHRWKQLPEIVVKVRTITIYERNLDRYMDRKGLERYGQHTGK